MATADVRQYTGDGDGHEPVPASPRYCEQIPPRVRELPADLTPGRARAILSVGSKWINGTVLRYAFFGHGLLAVPEEQRAVVRQAFADWKALGIGLDFKELDDLAESEIRIGFSGRRLLVLRGPGRPRPSRATEPTMNFGWDLTRGDGPATARPRDRPHPRASRTSIRTRSRASSGTRRPCTPRSASRPTTGPARRPSTTSCASSTAAAVRGLELGPGLDHAVPLRGRPDQRAGRPPQRGQPAGRALRPRTSSGRFKLYPALGPARDARTATVPVRAAEPQARPSRRNFTHHAVGLTQLHDQTFGTADTLLVLFEATRDGT